jgi:hypothetical protein
MVTSCVQLEGDWQRRSRSIGRQRAVVCRADEEEREMGIVAAAALGSGGGAGAWIWRWRRLYEDRESGLGEGHTPTHGIGSWLGFMVSSGWALGPSILLGLYVF